MSDITNRLRELAHAVADQRWSEFSMRVPADHDRDADLVLVRAADEITQLRAKLDDARSDMVAALSLVADVRAAIGDDGKRMQSELIEYCKAMKRDAERYRWLRRVATSGFASKVFGNASPIVIDEEIDTAMRGENG